MGKPQAPYLVPAVVTAVQILDYLREQGLPATLSEICTAVNVPRSSGLNIARTLQQLGLLEHDDDTRRYSLGPRLIGLGAAAANAKGFVALARPHLEALARETHLTACLVQRVGFSHVFLDKVESSAAIRINIDLGHIYPPFTGAPSKAFFAFMPAEQVERVWHEHPPVQATPYTFTDLTSYRAALERVREQCFADSVGEFIEGVNALASPIFGPDGSPTLALLLTGPQGALPEERMPHLGKMLWHRACTITTALGAKTPGPKADDQDEHDPRRDGGQ